MKTYNKPSVSKLVAKFDAELKNLLSNDLQLFIENNPFLKSKKNVNFKHTLSVA